MSLGGNSYEQGGTNSRQYNANIQTFHNQGPKEEKIATTPVSTVPFLRDPNFIERSEYRQLAEKLSSGRTRVALAGFGGAGKSLLGIEYCYRVKKSTPNCWVFWIHASSSERLDAGIRELADVLQLPGRQEKSADVHRLVERWLRGAGNQWVLILDNADLENVLFTPVTGIDTVSQGGVGKRKIDCLAIPSCGQTILTTRHKKIASQFVDECDIITVGPMIKPDAIALFRAKTGERDAKMHVEKLVGELGYVPLAIAHAAAFIRSQVPPCPVQTYLKKLGETIKSDASLLKANYNELRRDPEADNSVINTWQVSFEHVRRIRPSAADRLSLMSFYDHRGIPRSLLHMRDPHLPLPTDSETAGQLTSIDDDLNGDILILYDFHLIAVGIESEDLEIHPLVQLAARKWLKSQDKEDRWLRTCIRNLRYALPDDTDALSVRRFVLLPHFQLALTYETEDRTTGLFLAEICHNMSDHIYLADPQASLTWLRRALVERKRYLGNDHLSTLEIELELGRMLKFFREEEEGVCLVLERAQILTEKFSGRRISFQIDCLRHRAEDNARQGHHAKAETDLRLALGMCYEHSEYYHMSRCVQSLKGVVMSQDKQSEVETICRQALEACAKHHGSDHHYTLSATENLAEVFSEKGSLAEALEMHTIVFEARKRMHGASAIPTLWAMVSIVAILRLQNKMQEAADVSEQAHQMSSDRYGKESELALMWEKNHVISLVDLDKHDQALDVMRACVTGSQRTLGAADEETIKRTQLLASLEHLQEAKEELRKLEEMMDHPEIVQSTHEGDAWKCMVQ